MEATGHSNQNTIGTKLTAPSWDRWLYLLAYRAGLWARSEQNIFSQFVRPGDTVLDIGASIGVHTRFFAGLVGRSGHVIAVEPDPRVSRVLRQNLGTCPAEIYDLALGEVAEERKLCTSLLNQGNSHLLPGTGVRVASADQLFSERKVDFVKIDVEGMELRVLRGARTLFKSNPQLTLYLECWPRGLRRQGDSLEELWEELMLQDFVVWQKKKSRFQKLGGANEISFRFGFTNLLCVKNSRDINRESALKQ